jgi:hypothetical protein
MNLVPLDFDALRLGHPLPFPLKSRDGTLLAEKGLIVSSKASLRALVGPGIGLYLDIDPAADSTETADPDRTAPPVTSAALLQAEPVAMADGSGTGAPDWLNLQVQANALLRETSAPKFLARLERVHAQLNRHSNLNPDGTLFALIHLSASELRMYSATHAMLVSVMCGLAAREVLNWPPAFEATVCKAALTMNISMTDLQDRLAAQIESPTPLQRRQIDGHVAASVAQLQEFGVSDADWLSAVREHHSRDATAWGSMTMAERMARLIQRADKFAARLSPRAGRLPTSPAAAMQSVYFDEHRQIDETGAVLVKAVGIYQPGSFVRLASNETAVVIRRGGTNTTPLVAVLINAKGVASDEQVTRDTIQREFRIVASVAHRDVQVKMTLDRLLGFTSVTSATPLLGNRR